jgi:hypothetical protein
MAKMPANAYRPPLRADAVRLITWVESRGGRFEFTDRGDLVLDVSGIAAGTLDDEDFAALQAQLLLIADELECYLQSCQTTH